MCAAADNTRCNCLQCLVSRARSLYVKSQSPNGRDEHVAGRVEVLVTVANHRVKVQGLAPKE